MQRLFFLLSLTLLPLTSMAQDSRVHSPMLISGAPQNGAPASNAAAVPGAGINSPAPSNHIDALPMPTGFPEWAITKAAENSTGQPSSTPPANPAAPPTAPTSEAPAAPANAQAPSVPDAPTPVVDKLWPRDTVEIFLPSCTGFHPELVAACTCVITRLMLAMPHDEFLAKSEAGTIEQDQRLMTIRRDCVGTPQRRQ